MSNSTSGMDGIDPDEAAEIVSIVQQVIWENYCVTAATAVFMYDFLLTFGREVEHIWRQKFTGATALFLLMRYVHFFDAIVVMLEIFPWAGQSNRTCTVVYRIDQILTTTTFLVAAAFSTLRAYGIWARDKRVLVVVGLCGLVSPVLNLRYYISTTAEPFTLTGGCSTDSTMSLSTMERISYAARGTTVASDLMVLILTWIKTWSLRKEAKSVKMASPIATLLLRDGTIYFFILMTLNILYIALNARLTGFNPLPDFMDSFTAILVTRFLLDLRSIYYVDTASDGTDTAIETAHSSNISFASSVMGNMGAPLSGRFGDSDLYEDSEDTRREFSDDPMSTGMLQSLSRPGDSHLVTDGFEDAIEMVEPSRPEENDGKEQA